MPSKDPIQRFEDILENINRIEDFTAAAHEGPELDSVAVENADHMARFTDLYS